MSDQNDVAATPNNETAAEVGQRFGAVVTEMLEDKRQLCEEIEKWRGWYRAACEALSEMLTEHRKQGEELEQRRADFRAAGGGCRCIYCVWHRALAQALTNKLDRQALESIERETQ